MCKTVVSIYILMRNRLHWGLLGMTFCGLIVRTLLWAVQVSNILLLPTFCPTDFSSLYLHERRVEEMLRSRMHFPKPSGPASTMQTTAVSRLSSRTHDRWQPDLGVTCGVREMLLVPSRYCVFPHISRQSFGQYA